MIVNIRILTKPPSFQIATVLLGGYIGLEIGGCTREREDDGACGLEHAGEAEYQVVVGGVVQVVFDGPADDHQEQHSHYSNQKGGDQQKSTLIERITEIELTYGCDGEQAEICEVAECPKHAHWHDEDAHRHDGGEEVIAHHGLTTPRPQQIRESGSFMCV